jgi:hypothetical protein
MSERKSNDKEIWQTSICHRCEGEISIEDDGHCVIKHFISGSGHLVYIGFHPQCYIADELAMLPLGCGAGGYEDEIVKLVIQHADYISRWSLDKP